MVFGLNLVAQNRLEQKKEEMKSKKKDYISENLNLSSKKDKSFWPIYNEFQDEMESIKKDRRKIMFDIKKNFESSSEEELDSILNRLELIDEKEYKTKTSYHVALSKTLNAKERTLLIMSELNFKREQTMSARDSRDKNKSVTDPKGKNEK